MSTTRGRDPDSVIDRLRELASTAASTGQEPEPAPHPDAVLLDLCADIAQSLKASKAANKQWDDARVPWCERTLATVDQDNSLRFGAKVADRNYFAALRAAAKIPATTAAGVHAKAVACRASKTGAANLATSLANDLLAAPGLRSAIWPAEGAE